MFSTDSGIRSKSQGAFSKPLPDQVIQRAVLLHFPNGAIQFLPEPHVILTHPNSSTLVQENLSPQKDELALAVGYNILEIGN